MESNVLARGRWLLHCCNRNTTRLQPMAEPLPTSPPRGRMTWQLVLDGELRLTSLTRGATHCR